MAMKILVLDTETAPNTAHVWGLFKQNIGINQLIDTSRVMCFAGKWLGKPKVHFFSEFHHSHDAMILAAHGALTEADAVLTFNGERFDLPVLNKEFVKYGLAPPSPYRSIDLFKVAKRRFRFASNKLDHLLAELKLTRKVENRGHQLWIDCMAGKRAAWKEMKEYNIQDVASLEELYNRILPWIDSHPNRALYQSVVLAPTCPNCGSTKLQSRGLQVAKTQRYVRFQCTDCGTWSRERFKEGPRNKAILSHC